MARHSDGHQRKVLAGTHKAHKAEISGSKKMLSSLGGKAIISVKPTNRCVGGKRGVQSWAAVAVEPRNNPQPLYTGIVATGRHSPPLKA